MTVYGEWPGRRLHVRPFFTSMMTDAQVAAAAECAAAKQWELPLQVLYAGRLEKVKRVELLLEAMRLVRREGGSAELTVVGTGTQHEALEGMARAWPELRDACRFTGALPFDEVMRWYGKGHVLVLPSSHSEGWPKVLAEAMCHGVVSIGTAHGLIPWMLEGRGIVVPPEDPQALAGAILRLCRDGGLWADLSRRGGEWARQYSMDRLRNSLAELVAEQLQ